MIVERLNGRVLRPVEMFDDSYVDEVECSVGVMPFFLSEYFIVQSLAKLIA